MRTSKGSSFLSCLCGSEEPAQGVEHDAQFLSCLCGSEVLHTIAIYLIVKELTLISRLTPIGKEGVEPIIKSMS
ncbi:hypothetical protein SAMN05880558_10113 [Aeromonas sp. RU39B]|nr:hypothetical protein SAMN05880558_10113 [Aeromonas sp. RU39B]